MNKKIVKKIRKWFQDCHDSGTLPDPTNFPFCTLAMTTNGTSGIFRAQGIKWYFYIDSYGNIDLEHWIN